MTPASIASKMCEAVQLPASEWRVLDPACGDGVLLVAAARAMKATGVKDVATRLAGVDIDPTMVAKSRAALAVELGCSPDGVQVSCGDFLTPSQRDLFGGGPLPLDPRLNVVLSNPPYGRLREYQFFEHCCRLLRPGAELVFLVPLAFMDRVEGVAAVPLPGKPMGVTTGHAIVRHTVGERFHLRSVRGMRKNTSSFTVHTGVKLYEVGCGVPPQTEAVARAKPYSSESVRPGWIPCVRTGDVHPFRLDLGRLWVDHGPHLAHPKELARFSGPRLFLRRVPVWDGRRLAAVFVEELVLCAGDVLVVRHDQDDPRMLQGLCAYLNSEVAAETMLRLRPTLRHRDSFPKFSAKDVNALLEHHLPPRADLLAMADASRDLPQPAPKTKAAPPGLETEAAEPGVPLLEQEFPIEAVSEACAAEKSIRQEHISTLQLWWARRPLAICRSALFAAACPSPASIDADPELRTALESAVPDGRDTFERLVLLTSRLAPFAVTRDEVLLGVARRLLKREGDPLLVADSFAGGGSFPVEALRLGLRAFASDLNPVAVAALKVAVELLPGTGTEVARIYGKVAREVEKRISAAVKTLYCGGAEEPLAYFWCRTYACPSCRIEVPLLRDRWLAKGKRCTAVKLEPSTRQGRFRFVIYHPGSKAERASASLGTVSAKGAVCPNCSHHVPTSHLQEVGMAGKLGERLYAKFLDGADGRAYQAVSPTDEHRATQAKLRAARGRELSAPPSEPFDLNGIRHTWAMQYGVQRTDDLYSRRQSVALTEAFHEVRAAQCRLLESGSASAQVVSILLALTFNRLVMYGTRHTWWQANGEFPANMFGRQAIPMVWNYVEIPLGSPGAAGWSSARAWIEKVAGHLARLPGKGSVACGDAARLPLDTGSVDLVAIDPPYYDSIAYAYLSDVFYVWMRPLLRGVLPEVFLGALSPKEEEAIVDRRHQLAPSPKTGRHFATKMRAAFRDARRVLRPEGRLLVMFGHKKREAWEAFLHALFDAGFAPTTSWPTHTERKVKFRHGRVSALSSSCLLVCRPVAAGERPSVLWTTFERELDQELERRMVLFVRSGLFGPDLVTALIGPAAAYYARRRVVDSGGRTASIGQLLDHLAEAVPRCETAMLLARARALGERDVESLVDALSAVGNADPEEVLHRHVDLGKAGSVVHTAVVHAEHILAGRTQEADALWDTATDQKQEAMCLVYRALAQVEGARPALRQAAEAALGRMSMRLRNGRAS